MRIEIIAKNYKESNRLEGVLEKKMTRLEKYFTGDASAKVKLTTQANGKYTMEITVFQAGLPAPIRAEVTTDNMYDNVDILLPKIERQIAKFRTRQEGKKKERAALPAVHDEVEAEVKEKSKYGKIVKVKNFEISIITVEEAIEELELLDHNFYVFVNAEDNKVSVVYRRHDDDYGLITPEY